jgi:hypothetical protein
MPYILKKSNGLVLTTVADGSIDTTTTPLTFVGKNYAGYGQILDQNLVYLLENFANTTAPTKPATGQLWYDTASKLLKIYNGKTFRSIQNFDVSINQPLASSKGDTWFSESDQKLYVYNGSKFVLIGPSASEAAVQPLVAAESIDPNGNPYSVLKFIIPDASGYENIPAVISKDDFSTTATDILYSNYKHIYAGITLPGTNPINSGNLPGVSYPRLFHGTAASALGLYSVSSSTFHSADAYLLSSKYNSDLASGLSITNDAGLTVGLNSIFRFHADSGNYEGKITAIAGNRISFNLVSIPTGLTATVITMDQNNIIPSNWGINLGTSTSYFSSLYVTTITSHMVYADTFVGQTAGAHTGAVTGSVTGNVTGNTAGTHTGPVVGNVTGNLTGNVTGNLTGNVTGNLTGGVTGNITGTAGSIAGYNNPTIPATPSTIAYRDNSGNLNAVLFQGLATSAQFADLAEKYLADKDYEIGTVVVVGGELEVTASSWGQRAIGVVSANPAYMMNSELPGGTYIALKGRVPVKVIGRIKKGEDLIAADNGYAIMAVPHSSRVFGVALETSDNEGPKVIEALIL